jgi:hypothetical protein
VKPFALASIKILLKTLIIAAFAFSLFDLGADPMVLIGCDCQTFMLAAPSLAAQIIWLFLFALALFIPTKPSWLPARLIIALAAVLLSSHRLVIDAAHAEIRDIYLFTTIQPAPFDPSGGIAVTTHRVTTVITGINPTTTPLTSLSPPALRPKPHPAQSPRQPLTTPAPPRPAGPKHIPC